MLHMVQISMCNDPFFLKILILILSTFVRIFFNKISPKNILKLNLKSYTVIFASINLLKYFKIIFSLYFKVKFNYFNLIQSA